MIAVPTKEVAGHRQRSSHSRGRPSRARSQRCSRSVGARHLRATYDRYLSPESLPLVTRKAQVEQDEEPEEIHEDGPLDLELPSFVRDFLRQPFYAQGTPFDCSEEPCLINDSESAASHAMDTGALVNSVVPAVKEADEVSKTMGGASVLDAEKAQAEDIAMYRGMVEVYRSGPFGTDSWSPELYSLPLGHKDLEEVSAILQATARLEVEGRECQGAVVVCRSGPFGSDSSSPVWYTLAVHEKGLMSILESPQATRNMQAEETEHSVSADVRQLDCSTDSSTSGRCTLLLDKETLEKSSAPTSTSDGLEGVSTTKQAFFESVTRELAVERAKDVAARASPCSPQTAWAGSPACTLRSRRVAKRKERNAKREGLTAFALDVGEANPSKLGSTRRELSLVRGYEALGVEWHSMDRDDDDGDIVSENQLPLRSSPSQHDERCLSRRSPGDCSAIAVLPSTCTSHAGRLAPLKHSAERCEVPTFCPLNTSPSLDLKEVDHRFDFRSAKGIPSQRVSALSRALSWSRNGQFEHFS